MKKYYHSLFVGVLLALGACASDEPEWGTKRIEVEDMPQYVEPEKADGKMDVYTSMARAVKYNVDNMSVQMRQMLANPKGLTAKELLEKNIKLDADGKVLVTSLKKLDFALMYAFSKLEESEKANNEYAYQKASQYLALKAIQAHQDAWFAQRKIADIDRLVKKEQKILQNLDAKLEKDGALSEEELLYKKALDVELLNLSNMKKNLEENEKQYVLLTKLLDKKVNLEGRRFYELDELDRNFTAPIFVKAALDNRHELKYVNALVVFDDVKSKMIKSYPDLESLIINGYESKDQLYVQKLSEAADQLAENLISAVESFSRIDKTKIQEREFVRNRVNDYLEQTVWTQVEIAFALVKIAEEDYLVISDKVKSLTQAVRENDKDYRSDVRKKAEATETKQQLFEAQVMQSRILGEKAAALRQLYFYAGFSPFNRDLMQKKIREIASELRRLFSQDLKEMLAAAQANKPQKKVLQAKWNRDENWLEDVVENEQIKIPEKKSVKVPEIVAPRVLPQTSNALYSDAANSRKIMQLGAFADCDNAKAHWADLQRKYPELASLKGQIERVMVGGQEVNRLIVQSSQGGWVSLCNKLKNEGEACILR